MIGAEGSWTPIDLDIPSSGAVALKGWAWNWQSPTTRASLVIGHGLGEHGGLYSGLATELAATLRISVLAFDFRGHGRSPGQRGYVRRYRDLADDWRSAVRRAAADQTGRPVFALGHSNGGLAGLLAAVDGGLPVDGFVASNPALRIKMPVPAWKLAFGRVVRRLAPRFTLPGDLPVQSMTRDPLQQHVRLHDRAIHGRVSAPLFFGMRESAEEVLRHADRVTFPLLMILSQDDPIIEPESGRILFDRCGSRDKLLLEQPGMRHEPLSEIGRERVFAQIARWLDARLPAVT